MYNLVKPYSEYFCIFRDKKVAKLHDGWLFYDQHLTDSNIISTLTGLSVFGGYLQRTADTVGFDIDLHGKYLSFNFKVSVRVSRYNLIVKLFGTPSLVFQSSVSGGLHVFYKMKHRVFFEIIKREILRKFGMSERQLKENYGIEILPTPKKSLRLPYSIKEGGALLDVETLKYAFQPTAENVDLLMKALSQAKTYHFAEIFDRLPEVDDLFLKQTTRKAQFENYKKLNRLEKYEAKILPVSQGSTNIQIEELAFNCFCNGLDQSQAFARIDKILDDCRIVRDIDTQEKRLRQRIDSHYERFVKQASKSFIEKIEKEKPQQYELFTELKVDEVVKRICENRNITHKASIRRLKNFLMNLSRWVDYIENLSDFNRTMMTYKYNYFYHNTKTRGLIPLPKVLMRRWGGGYYNEVLSILIDERILELGQNYSTILGVSKYYKVNL